jgi:uncharacterized membrane protein
VFILAHSNYGKPGFPSPTEVQNSIDTSTHQPTNTTTNASTHQHTATHQNINTSTQPPTLQRINVQHRHVNTEHQYTSRNTSATEFIEKHRGEVVKTAVSTYDSWKPRVI